MLLKLFEAFISPWRYGHTVFEDFICLISEEKKRNGEKKGYFTRMVCYTDKKIYSVRPCCGAQDTRQE